MREWLAAILPHMFQLAFHFLSGITIERSNLIKLKF